jgi:hypothetical protein
MALPSDQEVDNYIAQRASQMGFNPQKAVQVSRAERGARSGGWIGDHGTSFGPFQLHIGGEADNFRRDTGLDPRDISGTWRQQVDYVMSTILPQKGWQPFHAAVAIGIGTWDGIKQGAANVASTATNLSQSVLQYFFPVVGYTGNPHATYHSPGGSDLFAPIGTGIRAIVDSVVSEAGSGDALGGNWLLLHGRDGLDYYYAHMNEAPGLKAGDFVQGGSIIGHVGKTGNAANTDPHLHIGIGHGIQEGSGPEGGTGRDFDAQTFLTRVLDAGGDVTDMVSAAIDTSGTYTSLLQTDIAGMIRTGITAAFSNVYQNTLNYTASRGATIALLVLGIVLVIGGIWGIATQSSAGRTAIKGAVSVVGGPVGGPIAAAL